MHLEPLEPRLLFSATGDLNGDGLVNAADAQLIAEYAVHRHDWPVPGNIVDQGDLDGDGKLTGFDASLALSLAPYDGHSLTLAGVVNVWAPNPDDFGPMWLPTIPLYGPLGNPDMNTIVQGQLADCYVLAGIGALAIAHPDMIKALLTVNGTDVAVTWQTTESVKLVVHTYEGLSRRWQTNSGETWWEYFEKTYAYFRTWNHQIIGQTQVNTVHSIEWGDVSTVMIQLQDTPVTEPSYSTATNAANEKVVLKLIADTLAADKPLTFQTRGDATTMIQSHVYVITGVDVAAGTVTLRNPWGFTEVRTIDDLLNNALPTWAFVTGA